MNVIEKQKKIADKVGIEKAKRHIFLCCEYLTIKKNFNPGLPFFIFL